MWALRRTYRLSYVIMLWNEFHSLIPRNVPCHFFCWIMDSWNNQLTCFRLCHDYPNRLNVRYYVHSFWAELTRSAAFTLCCYIPIYCVCWQGFKATKLIFLALILSVDFLFPFQGPVLCSIELDWHWLRGWCETFMILYKHLPSRLIITLLRSLTVMCTLHILILLLRQSCSLLLLLTSLRRTLNRVWRSNVAGNTGIYQPLPCCSGLCGTSHHRHELHRSQSCPVQPLSIFPQSTFYLLHVWHSAVCLIERSCHTHQSCTSSLHHVQCRICSLPRLISCSQMKRIARKKKIWGDISA